MRKSLSVFSVLALSVGIALSAAPAQAALPLMGNSQEMPSLAPVLEQVTPAVVNISVSGKKITRQRLPEQFRFFFGPNMPDEQVSEQPFQALGSGVIIDAKKGYVITNAHVVHEADEIKVNLKDGREYAAKKIGEDKQSDIALLQIKAEDLVQIKFADSDELRVGDYALAIGNPFGLGQTVTSGIVSALGRNQLGINTFENFIQTDAAINPGNSGGALVDTQGRLLGINTAIYSRSGGSMGIGFAIPVSTGKQVLESIVKDGQVTRGWIGVEPQDLSPEVAEAFGIKPEALGAGGVIITGVLQNGPAAQAGIVPGDVITTVAGKPVRTVTELLSAVAALKPGVAAPLGVLRKDKKAEIAVVPGTRQRPKIQR